MKFRKLESTDYKEYLSLISEFRPTTFTEDEFVENLTEMIKYSDIWILEINTEIVATITIIYEQKFIYNLAKLAHIEDVCVKNIHRGKGYGRQIVQKAITEARSKGCYKITLVCNPDIKDFYEKCLFEQRGIQMSRLL